MMRNDIVERGLDHQGAGTGMAMMMSAGGGVGQRKGGSVAVQQGLKKGPWTAAEDAILMEYVKKHGEGNWNSVQKNCGLLRCGKSCRLRWANHLRPNLKKGAFTPEEERQLPGRTDNEIKNYWNTRMKRRQRAGLPVYPTEFQDQAAAFHHIQRHEQNNLTDHNNNKSSSLFSVFRKAPDYTSSCFSLSADGLPDFSPTPAAGCFKGHSSNNTNLPSSAFYGNNTTPHHHQYQYLNAQNGAVFAPLSFYPLVSTFAPPPVTGGGGGENMPSNFVSFTSLIMGDYDADQQLESFSFASASELPSLQTPPRSASSNATGGGGGGVCVVAEGSDNGNSNSDNNTAAGVTKGNDQDTLTVMENNNSGLLDALLMESKVICRKRKADEMDIGAISSTAAEEEGNFDAAAAVAKRKCTAASFWGASNGEQQASCEGGGDNLLFAHSSIVMEPAKEETVTATAEEMSSMDDDLLSLLTNFPSSIPLPEWYREHSTIQNTTTNVNMKEKATAVGTCGGGCEASPALQGP
ncbi:unnamed protein product [Linum tenue]|uniref:Uncharacterized protein n=1 Tax=Linum tenue TaxID=586396 RepID=A0AAV0QYU7_9ROSI|nr:unnamed protein product [Linum tenue]